MPALFPSSLPVPGSASSSSTLAAAGHTALHNNDRDEIRALASKVGTGASTPASGKVLRGTGVGTSVWGAVGMSTDVTGVLSQGNGGTGTTDATGSGPVVYGTSPSIVTPTISGGGSWAGSPTITTPTIADLTNTQHVHSNAASGGSLGTGVVSGANLATSAIELGYAQATTSTSGVSTETDIAGLSVPVTVPAGGRDALITVQLSDVTTSVDAQRVALQIKEGSTQFGRIYKYLPSSASGGNGLSFFARVSAPSAGSHTYKATITRDIGAGTVAAYAGAIPDQSFILVTLI